MPLSKINKLFTLTKTENDKSMQNMVSFLNFQNYMGAVAELFPLIFPQTPNIRCHFGKSRFSNSSKLSTHNYRREQNTSRSKSFGQTPKASRVP
ncbi:hypothetical protein CDAR_426161 [Caerostris darwini]|uniref:Uncharacterized protein n=1 Tax=Caerostris darwini TaxID=1538125 RepID=A0AAV4MU83_9ARAC|nr:hypothetical protein CDAR_426161 [Caerostris darwini]